MPSGITTSSNTLVYPLTADGLNQAIQDLAETSSSGGGGTIWIWEPMVLTSPVLLKSNISLDFQGNTVYLDRSSGGHTINFLYGTGVRHAQVHNVTVLPHIAQTAPIIFLSPSTDHIEGNLFSNITIQNPYPLRRPSGNISYPSHFYDGLLLRGSVHDIRRNNFNQITFTGVRHGIKFEVTEPATEPTSASYVIEDNYLANITVDGFMTLVFFVDQTAPPSHFNRNTFEHLRGKASNYSICGFCNISGNSNHFDHVGIDHSSLGFMLVDNPLDVLVSYSAEDTYICAQGLHEVVDGGWNTILDPPSRPASSPLRQHY